MMQVLMISHLYPSRADQAYGTFVHSQVKALRDVGCRVAVVAPTAWAPFPLYLIKEKWRRFHTTPWQDTYEGVQVLYPRVVRTPGAVLFEYAGYDYFRAIRRVIGTLEPFDIIHAQVGYPDGWAAARLARQLGKPLVVTLHGQELQKIVKRSARLKKLVLDTLSAASAVVVVSEKMLNLAKGAGVSSTKLHLINNGVEKLASVPLSADIQNKLTGKKVLLTVSRLVPEKGVQHALRAFADLIKNIPGLVYVIVGDGPYRDDLSNLASSLGVADRVIFAGSVPHAKVGGYYQAADAFVLTSKDEAFGIVYLEAMAAGLPVVATKGEGISRLVAEENTGLLVEYGDVPGLKKAVADVLEPESAVILGANGRKVAGRFTWEQNARQLVELYKNLCRRG